MFITITTDELEMGERLTIGARGFRVVHKWDNREG